MRTSDFERYVEACNYPGEIDKVAVEKHLKEYLGALGIKKEVVQIDDLLNMEIYPDLLDSVKSILLDLEKRNPSYFGEAARAALAALDALDALRRFAAWCVQYTGWYSWRWELSWLVTSFLGAQQTQNEKVRSWSRPLFEAFVSGAWFLYWTENTLYWVAKPTMHYEEVDGEKRLHNEYSAAIESDVENMYYWHGVLVPAFVVVKPDWITIKHIASEENAEVRRVMIERYESAKYVGAYIHDSGAQVLHKDEYGILYRQELDGDEPIVMVRLLNRTPEPEGNLSSAEALEIFGEAAWRVKNYPPQCRWKEYYKRVHPELRPMWGMREGSPIFGNRQPMTARAAVASTRGLYADQYFPEESS